MQIGAPTLLKETNACEYKHYRMNFQTAAETEWTSAFDIIPRFYDFVGSLCVPLLLRSSHPISTLRRFLCPLRELIGLFQ